MRLGVPGCPRAPLAAAVNLNRHVGGSLDGFGGKILRHAYGNGAHLPLILDPPRLIDEKTGGVGVHLHLGKHVLHQLEAGNGGVSGSAPAGPGALVVTRASAASAEGSGRC